LIFGIGSKRVELFGAQRTSLSLLIIAKLVNEEKEDEKRFLAKVL